MYLLYGERRGDRFADFERKDRAFDADGAVSHPGKEPSHFSNIYGNFLDKTGRVVRSGVSEKIDTAPSGTHFEGAPMRWFMRLTNGGVGMHIGILPGYAASHGCVRLPADIAPLIYERVKVGTVVTVQE